MHAIFHGDGELEKKQVYGGDMLWVSLSELHLHTRFWEFEWLPILWDYIFLNFSNRLRSPFLLIIVAI